MKTVFAARSATVALVGVLTFAAMAPAHAAAPAAAGTAAASIEAPAAVAAKASPRRYCVRTEMTGSRIDKKICRTRNEWLDSGFDPLAPGK